MKNFLLLLLGSLLMWTCTSPKPETTEALLPPPVEFTDSTYMVIGKQSLAQLANGDVEGFAKDFADNIIFRWSNGDSLAGKQVVTDYWKERRSKTIDTMKIKQDIWLGVKANQPQPGVMPGTYLFGWFNLDVTYVNGKTVNMWVHHVYHFNDDKKVAEVNQFLDRAPINAALAAK